MKSGGNGRAVLIVLIFLGVFTGLGYLFFVGFKSLSQLVPLSVSLGAIVLGTVSIISGKLMLTKKFVYHKDSPDQIRLDSPAYADYMYLYGLIILGGGILTLQPLLSWIDTIPIFKILFAMFCLGAVLWFLLLVIRLKNSVNDKIIISKNEISLDDPMTSASTHIKRDDIQKISYLKTFNYSKNGYLSTDYSYSLSIHMKATGEDEPKVHDVNSSDMNIQLQYVVEALEEMKYTLTLTSVKSGGGDEWEGHKFR
jgi:hypothetical protein